MDRNDRGFEKCAASAWLKGSVVCGLLLGSLASLATPAVGRVEVEGGGAFSLLCDRSAGGSSKGEDKTPEEAGRKGGLFSSREGITALVFRNRTAFTPYLGAGIGPAADIPDEAGSEQPPVEVDPESAYRFGAGFDCALDDSTRLGLGYRFHTGGIPGLDEEDAEGGAKDPGGIHHFSIGIEKKF